MADPDETYGHWLRPPERPIRYTFVQRIEDWHNGRRDGGKGFPAIPDTAAVGGKEVPADPDSEAVSEPVATTVDLVWTPYIRLLVHRASDSMHGELIGREQHLAGRRHRLKSAEIQCESRSERLAAAEGEVKSAGTSYTEEMINARRTVEEVRDRPEYLSRSRRLTEQSRSVARAEAARSEEQKHTDDAKIAASAVAARIASEERVAAARARRVHEHCHRRIASYWRHLVRRHPQGHVVIGALTPGGPELPSWAQELTESD